MMLIYVTCPDIDLARKISKALIDERLAACTNILPGMESHYRWQGKVETAQEIVLLIKTKAKNYSLIEERVRALHSYEVPCIVAWPIAKGSSEYLAWIDREASPGPS